MQLKDIKLPMYATEAIERLRKGEVLALKYSPEGYLVAFSGGKDSQAVLHLAQAAGVKFTAYWSPTTLDPAENVRFIKTQYPEVDIIKPKASVYTIAKKKGLPTRLRRWCCAQFKEVHGAGRVVVTGVRRAESTKRAERNEIEIAGRKFSGNFEEFAEDQAQRVTCIGGRDKIMINPIIDWTDQQVWHFLNINKIPHNPLYDMGRSRVGCLFCPMAGADQKSCDMKTHPHLYAKWLDVIETLKRDKGVFPELTAEQAFEWWIGDDNLKDFTAKTKLPKLF